MTDAQTDEHEKLELLRHSAAHVMAQAVKRLFPEAKLGIGPAIQDGFYYDFEVGGEQLSTRLHEVEEEMRRIIAEDLSLEREELDASEAHKLFQERHEPYKIELLEDISDSKVSVYRQGEFVDLCRGPHLERTGQLSYFKLLSVAGAYWRGKETNPMLTRIYGTAFTTQQELDAYLQRIEAAKARDHRRLGKDLELFTMTPDAGGGLVLYQPRGAAVRTLLEAFERREHVRRGYQSVITPHISRADLWRVSGHLDFYRDNMYVFSVAGEDYVLKPMNCPGHILLYQEQLRSYRDLPVRYFELGTVYRHEESGVLHGLLRTRGFTQDDAHIFCTSDQLVDEVRGVLEFVCDMMHRFDLGFEIAVSTRPEHYIGEPASWKHATDALTVALEQEDLSYHIDPGEGAFYGPKIDVQMRDALGRLWQGPTIQVDFNLPERFDLTYVDSDGSKKRVVMIHRVVLGSIERFLGVLLEHYAGKLPVWLAPIQVRVLPISDHQAAYGAQVRDTLQNAGIRVELDDRNAKLGYKIREAEMAKIPYMVIAGSREAEAGTISVRSRAGENLQGWQPAQLIARVREEIEAKIGVPWYLG